MISPRDLIGTSVSGALHIDQPAINHVLRLGSPLTVEIRSRNRVLVRYGMFYAHAVLPEALQVGPSPQLTVTLASIVVAWGLKAAIHQPFVHVHGRQVTVKLAEVPALQRWRDFFVHLKAVEFTTTDGCVEARFTLAIAE